MPNQDLANLRNLMEELQPLLTHANNTRNVRQMRNEVQADWLTNFMDTMESRVEAGLGPPAEDPRLNKETGLVHTVESMVKELGARVGLDALSKTAGSSAVISALSKLRLPANEGIAGLTSLNALECLSLANELNSMNKLASQPALSAKAGAGTLDSALKKIRAYKIDDLNESEIRSLVNSLSKLAEYTTANKEDLERISNYVEGKMSESGNFAGIEQILSGIMSDNKMRDLSAKLGRDTIKAHVSKLLSNVDRPEENGLLPQAKPGAVGAGSQMSTGPNDPNKYMFTSSNPSAKYT